jgi:hypothetical protein
MKYTEQILRHAAISADGMPCEILERITFAQEPAADGSLGEPVPINRRFDLKTGERVNHLGGDDYEHDLTGVRLRVQR